jgi:HPt (histidine-containing phosphotransfer) domain-containing protein
MDIKLQATNLDYVEEISGGDNDFKKELIQIFMKQIPEFIDNMNKFLTEKNYPDLAKEAHTAKSSVLIFRMEETGKKLKSIQLNAEENQIDSIPNMIEEVKMEMESASKELSSILKDL